MIYLDNNATTQPLPEVVEAMIRSLREGYANPSSVHQFGQSVRHQVECARAQVAAMIAATPKEIVFTSGGTESINLAIRGALSIHPNRRHIVTTAVEHTAVLSLMEQLETQGYTVDYVGVDRQGRLDEEQWARRLTDDTALASIIHANNETGVIFDVRRLAAVAADRGIPVHVDAVQSAGKTPINVGDWPVQLVSLAAHKFHGPKGAGALYVRRRTRIEPLIVGGRQERLLRGGTEAVAEIIGMGVAAEFASRDCETVSASVRAMRDALEAGILANLPSARVNGAGAPRNGNTSNISFPDLEAEAILLLLSEAGICASSGAACSSGSLEPSHVLKAMGIDESTGHGAIRFSLSRFNTQQEMDRVVAALPDLLSRLTVLSNR
ncbi:MAG: aminotransferase class V-fold PLP-dependent enzyme [Planctomycetes bacterium]|nr:aminotransferase class V-fold PLP-dependent enzyme [Planctomycetota bacterium]